MKWKAWHANVTTVFAPFHHPCDYLLHTLLSQLWMLFCMPLLCAYELCPLGQLLDYCPPSSTSSSFLQVVVGILPPCSAILVWHHCLLHFILWSLSELHLWSLTLISKGLWHSRGSVKSGGFSNGLMVLWAHCYRSLCLIHLYLLGIASIWS